MNADYKLIGSRIKSIRKTQNMTQEQLAEHLGVSVGYISQVERGITKINLDLLASITGVLSCDLSELVAGAAAGTKNYLSAEIAADFDKLNTENKRLAVSFIRLLLETHQ
ncbi:MAG: helix-turn-helix transcriptional regulator [Clostridia bacterium]|nr:helix-turn-helix transcriptional regulator [Clostridia bacterium]